MRCSGTYTDLEIDIDETNGDIIEAVVTESKISIDWVEDGESFHASLASSDGVEYHGSFGEPVLNRACKMKGIKYATADGSILLLARWNRFDTGTSGSCYFELLGLFNCPNYSVICKCTT